jgi:large subunit ribosomal protein L3
MQTILGRKLGMTQIFDQVGNVVPVTVVQAGPCPVIQKKTVEKDGYSAIQLGFDEVKEKALNKPELGHLKKHGAPTVRKIHEVRVEDTSAVGDVIKCDIFEVGQIVDVQGTSKGKGTAGVMKRHNFGGGRASHGASLIHRMPASNGPVDPARTFKGKKRAGQMGNKTVTTQGLTVAAVDSERNLLLIRGAVPGAKGSLVVVKKSVKG